MAKSKTFYIKPHLVKHYRNESKITQDSLAEETGQSIENIKKIERDGRTTRKTAEKIADALGTPLEVLTGENESLLSNYWLQFGTIDHQLNKPGKLFQYSFEMLYWIKEEIESYANPHFSFEAEAKLHGAFSQNGLFSTLHFSENHYAKGLTFRFAKVHIDNETGISSTTMSHFEQTYLKREITNFLLNNTTSFECDNKLYREGNCYAVTVYNLIDEECHTCPSTTVSDIIIPTNDEETPQLVRTVVDSRIFHNSLDCVAAISRLVHAKEIRYFSKWINDNNVVFTLHTGSSSPTYIQLQRKHRDPSGAMHDAAFPYKEDIADRIQEDKPTFQFNIEEAALADFPARPSTSGHFTKTITYMDGNTFTTTGTVRKNA